MLLIMQELIHHLYLQRMDVNMRQKIQAEKLFGSLWLMEEFFLKGVAHCAATGLF